MIAIDTIARKTRSGKHSRAAGIFLLLLSFLIGLSKIYFGRFVDEAETMTVGWMISQGAVLYRDVFSHHFPLSYYWVAAVVGLFGSSFVVLRVSLLLLQVGLFAITMKLTGFYLAIGLASLAWNLINQFHRGQELIYPNFEALFMAAAFILIFASFVKKSTASRFTLAFTGLLLGLAVLTDPLMIYPAAVAFAGVLASGILSASPKPLREGLRRALWAGLPAVGVVGFFLMHLYFSGSIQEFYRSAIWFNADIYAKYVDANPIRFREISQNIASGLHILDPRWVKNTSPWLPLEAYRSVSLVDEPGYFSWIFSSFLSRLAFLACMAGLFLNRRRAAGIFLYLFAAALLVRFDDGFYANGFTLLSIFAASYLLVELWRPALIHQPGASKSHSPASFRFAGRASWITLLLVIAAMQSWAAFRGGFFIASNWNTVMSDRHIVQYKKLGDEVRQLSCNQKNIELSVFPINPIVNFVTGIPPASRFVFMYPWVAEIGQQELIHELSRNPSVVVWINTARKEGSPAAPAAYMADTIDFLNNSYVSVGKDLWISPGLARGCVAVQGQNPQAH